MSGRALLAGAALAAAGAALVWGEAVNARSSTRGLGAAPGAPGSAQAVVVLGYGNRGDRANLVNRWRVRVGLRSLDPRAVRAVLVLSGGAVAGAVPEAVLMERHARALGYHGAIELETDSTTTWENVCNVIPLLEDADRIAFASHSLHAETARVYLRSMRPDLADRLVRAADYRLGEWLLLKPLTAWIGIRHLRRLRRGGIPRA